MAISFFPLGGMPQTRPGFYCCSNLFMISFFLSCLLPRAEFIHSVSYEGHLVSPPPLPGVKSETVAPSLTSSFRGSRQSVSARFQLGLCKHQPVLRHLGSGGDCAIVTVGSFNARFTEKTPGENIKSHARLHAHKGPCLR